MTICLFLMLKKCNNVNKYKLYTRKSIILNLHIDRTPKADNNPISNKNKFSINHFQYVIINLHPTVIFSLK